MSDDLKYRFDEMITTINLLPDDPDDVAEGSMVFPNLTRDIHEPELYTALLCQAMKGNEDFKVKMCATLTNSAMTNITQNDSATEDDIYALAISANIMWAEGAGTVLLHNLGILGAVCNKYELELPSLALILLRPNEGAKRFAKLDPYLILKGEYEAEDIIRLAADKE